MTETNGDHDFEEEITAEEENTPESNGNTQNSNDLTTSGRPMSRKLSAISEKIEKVAQEISERNSPKQNSDQKLENTVETEDQTIEIQFSENDCILESMEDSPPPSPIDATDINKKTTCHCATSDPDLSNFNSGTTVTNANSKTNIETNSMTNLCNCPSSKSNPELVRSLPDLNRPENEESMQVNMPNVRTGSSAKLAWLLGETHIPTDIYSNPKLDGHLSNGHEHHNKLTVSKQHSLVSFSNKSPKKSLRETLSDSRADSRDARQPNIFFESSSLDMETETAEQLEERKNRMSRSFSQTSVSSQGSTGSRTLKKVTADYVYPSKVLKGAFPEGFC